MSPSPASPQAKADPSGACFGTSRSAANRQRRTKLRSQCCDPVRRRALYSAPTRCGGGSVSALSWGCSGSKAPPLEAPCGGGKRVAGDRCSRTVARTSCGVARGSTARASACLPGGEGLNLKVRVHRRMRVRVRIPARAGAARCLLDAKSMMLSVTLSCLSRTSSRAWGG